jgi:hypothetical protein
MLASETRNSARAMMQLVVMAGKMRLVAVPICRDACTHKQKPHARTKS